MKKRLVLFLSMFLLISLFSCSPSREEKWDIKKQSIEEKAPDFTLEDLKGNKVKLSDYRGKVVLLVFSATWCPYCKAEIPKLKELYSRYKGKGFEIINIDVQESKKKVSSFTALHGLPYKVLLDEDGQVARAYGVKGVPNKIVIDQEGIILCRACRSSDVVLEMLLGAEFKGDPGKFKSKEDSS